MFVAERLFRFALGFGGLVLFGGLGPALMWIGGWGSVGGKGVLCGQWVV